MFDPSLAQYLEETEPGLRVLSVSGMAAPRFAELAQQGARQKRADQKASSARTRADRPKKRRRADPILVRLAIVSVVVTVLSAWFFSRALGVGVFVMMQGL